MNDHGRDYERTRMFVGIMFVAMVIYAFDPDKYTTEEIGNFSEETCKALAKHDAKNVQCYEFSNKSFDNVAKVMNRENRFVRTKVFEK